MRSPRSFMCCAAGFVLASIATPSGAAAHSVPADSSALRRETAVLCETLFFIDYKRQRGRVLVAYSRRVIDLVVEAAVRATRRSGRSVIAGVHATSGIVLDPENSYRLAWECPARQRNGNPTITHPPFHAVGRFGIRDSALRDWRDLASRVVAHDARPAPPAVRLAQELGVGELLVVMVGGRRVPRREQLEAGWNPLAREFDEEGLNWPGSSATLELALYDGVEGRQKWAFTDQLTSWNTKPRRVADWTVAAMELMPSPGAEDRHEDATSPRFHPPDRDDIVLRLGGAGVAGDDAAFVFGGRATHLFRPWVSAGFQLDLQLIRASRFGLGGRGTGSPYSRELQHADVELYPFYPVLEFHFPRFARTLPTLGVAGGYALASLRAEDYDTQLLGCWGWAMHGNLRWRVRHVAIGLEAWTQSAHPERDGTDPMTLEPVRERLDFDGWGLSLALTAWQ